MPMTVRELIAKLQEYDGDLIPITPVYEIDHTVYYDTVHTVRLMKKGEEYGETKAWKDFVVIDARR